MSQRGKIPNYRLSLMQNWPEDLYKYVPISEATSFYFFSQGYLAKLCRQKRVPACKVAGKWFVKLSEPHRSR